MKKRFLEKVKSSIKNQYPNYSNEKIEEIMYGIEGLYITIEKSIIIIGLSFVLGIFKELIILLLMFNFIRLFAFGMHAPNGTICLIISSLIFIGFAYLIKIITINLPIMIILYIFILISVILFAPADTVKRPLIKKKRRTIYKVISIIITLIYFSISLLIKNNLIINSMLFGLIIESILINPITYKIFKLPYDNYKNYGLNTN